MKFIFYKSEVIKNSYFHTLDTVAGVLELKENLLKMNGV